MTARVECRDHGPVVIAPLSEWQKSGRFLLARFKDKLDPYLMLEGFASLDEAQTLADQVNKHLALSTPEIALFPKTPHDLWPPVISKLLIKRSA
jgi:hypothetical protein